MRHELAFTQIGAREIEDRSQDLLRVALAEVLDQLSIVVDVGDEQRNRPADGASLCNRDRRRIDEGVVGREAALLIEKNGKLRGQAPLPLGGSDNRKTRAPIDAREKRPRSRSQAR